jgi:hypothetical protein
MELKIDYTIEDDHFLSSSQIRQMFGNISAMSLWRWLHDPALDFPKPIVIQKRQYWRRGAILDFIRRREARAAVEA